MNSDRIAQLEPRQKPAASQIIQEVRDAILTAQQIGVFTKIDLAHRTQRCIWDNQHDDGMKHGADAFPYDRAIDSRVPLADEIISDNVRARMSAIRTGNVLIGPMDEIEDSEKAKLWDNVLKYYRAQNNRAFLQHFRLFQTCVEAIGYGVLHVDWRENKVLKPQEITEAQLIGHLAKQQLDLLLADQPELEGQIPSEIEIEVVNQATARVSDLLSNSAAKDAAIALLLAIDDTMTTSEARRVIPQLLKEGKATYNAPRGAGGQPCIKARIPWVDCGHAMDLGPDGDCSWWFVNEWLSEAALRERCEQEQCPKEWLEAVLKHPNKGMAEMTELLLVPKWLLNGVGLGLRYDQQQNQKAPMFQILTVYRKAVNKAGIPAIYETIVSPWVDDELGKHELCPIGTLPFVAEARESCALMVQSRSVGEVVLTDQLGLKKLKDATSAMAELAAFPPYERAMGDNTRLAPGVDLPAKRNTGTSGTQSKFLDVPGVDMGALRAREMTLDDVDRLFVRRKDEDPDRRRRYLEDLGEAAIHSYEETIRLIWVHVRTYVSELTASRVAGRPVSIKATAEDLEGTADIKVEFSSMAFNQKTALDLADYVTTLAGLDKSGRIDFGRAVELITRIFDPVLSESIILPGEEASAAIEKDEQSVIAAIASGQYVTGRTNSPQVRWNVLKDWLQNPSTIAALRSNPATYAALTEHVKGLSQEMVQKGENVFTGQTGQKPDAPWNQGQQPDAQLKQMIEGQPMAPMAA